VSPFEGNNHVGYSVPPSRRHSRSHLQTKTCRLLVRRTGRNKPCASFIGEATPDIDRVSGTSLDKGVELDALAKMAEPEREALISKAQSGETMSARSSGASKRQRAAETRDLKRNTPYQSRQTVQTSGTSSNIRRSATLSERKFVASVECFYGGIQLRHAFRSKV
jgi:hypothetical protein